MFSLIVIGGGAAGFFAALKAKADLPSGSGVLLLEKTGVLLSKVKISGGGRCNVTHSCFDPTILVKNYPRGARELLGPFTRFQPRDTIEWFESRGVKLKKEEDGRMFPITDSSSTIINALLKEADTTGVEIRFRQKIDRVEKKDDHFEIFLESGEVLLSRALILASGSSPGGHALASALGHSIEKPVPSLFTFNIENFSLEDIPGISLAKVSVSLKGFKGKQEGPILVTHVGFSGPSILRLSAFAARYLAEKNYREELIIDWVPEFTREELIEKWEELRHLEPTKTLGGKTLFSLPKNLFKKFLELSGIPGDRRIYDIKKERRNALFERLKNDRHWIMGKTTHKEEFVTAGGIKLKEVNFKTMESRLCKGLYFVGEILDIDGVTGGFNFQNAWTTGWIAGKSVASTA